MKTFEQLDEFTKAYIICALWSSTDDNDEPLDKNYSADDLAPKTLKRIIQDCEAFQNVHAKIPQYNNPEYSDAGMAGHDFWLSRNGHGAGFFDRYELNPKTREELQEAAEIFGKMDLYVGDDGKIYC